VSAPHSTSDAASEKPRPITDVVIPVLNERRALPLVFADIPPGWIREVVVVDNGSTDGSAEVARGLGATVVHEPRRGYGQACLAGIRELAARPHPPDVVLFLDADHSDHADELPRILAPIAEGRADFVVGSRVLGEREPGALLPQARFGNWLASWLIRRLYGLEVTDLGPFRAIRWTTLVSLEMADTNFGWTAEMQVKAARRGVRYTEVPTSYRRRVGVSKITGTVSGTLRAGWKILYTVWRYRC
jgi:glycosyltransferase involved in cell wall biosynthesis